MMGFLFFDNPPVAVFLYFQLYLLKLVFMIPKPNSVLELLLYAFLSSFRCLHRLCSNWLTLLHLSRDVLYAFGAVFQPSGDVV